MFPAGCRAGRPEPAPPNHSRKTQVPWTTTRIPHIPPPRRQARGAGRKFSPRYRQPSNGRGIVEIGITARAARGVVGPDLGGARPRLLLAFAAARRAGRGLPGAAVHDPARLRPRRLLPPPPRQRLGRPRHRRVDADALRFLAPHPRAASRHVGQSRSPRHRRHRYADGARISRRCRSGAGCAIASTGIRWSCSASVRPICSCCSTGFRSA